MLTWTHCKARLHRILLEILLAPFVVFLRADPVLVKTSLPYGELSPQVLSDAARRTTFDHLHGLLQRNIRIRRENGVEMIGHHDEVVQEIEPLLTIAHQRIKEDGDGRLVDEELPALPSFGGDEVRARGFDTMLWAGH